MIASAFLANSNHPFVEYFTEPRGGRKFIEMNSAGAF